jgi:hypothetical protein
MTIILNIDNDGLLEKNQKSLEDPPTPKICLFLPETLPETFT